MDSLIVDGGLDRELIAEREAMDPGLKERDSWKQCASLLLKLDRKRRAVSSDHVFLDEPEKELPIVSSLYTGFREVGPTPEGKGPQSLTEREWMLH